MTALLLTVLLAAQTPADPPTDLTTPAGLAALAFFAGEGEEKPPAAGTLEAAIATALRNHPDVKVAEAKRLLADAELEQTKLAVTKQISSATVTVQAAKEMADVRAQALAMTESVPGAAKLEVLRYKMEVVDARAAVLKGEEVLKAALGGTGKAITTTAEGIAAAVKTHPDVKVAEAKRAVADAELEQTRLAISQKVTVAFAKRQQAAAKVAATEMLVQRTAILTRQGNAPKSEADAAEARAKEAKADLAAAEAELKAATGGDSPADTTLTRARFLSAVQKLHAERADAKAPAGSPADKLRDLIDKKVKLDLKGTDLPAAVAEVFKAAGADGITVRGATNFGPAGLRQPPKVAGFNGEQSFTAWVQMLIDDFNRESSGLLPSELAGRYDLYVREYGLSFTRADLAPKDALTLAEFAKAVRAEKAAAKEKNAEPKK